MSSGPKLDTTLACIDSVHTCVNAINWPFQRPVATLHRQTCQYIPFIYKHMKGEENSLPIKVHPSLGPLYTVALDWGWLSPTKTVSSI